MPITPAKLLAIQANGPVIAVRELIAQAKNLFVPNRLNLVKFVGINLPINLETNRPARA